MSRNIRRHTLQRFIAVPSILVGMMACAGNNANTATSSDATANGGVTSTSSEDSGTESATGGRSSNTRTSSNRSTTSTTKDNGSGGANTSEGNPTDGGSEQASRDARGGNSSSKRTASTTKTGGAGSSDAKSSGGSSSGETSGKNSGGSTSSTKSTKSVGGSSSGGTGTKGGALGGSNASSASSSGGSKSTSSAAVGGSSTSGSIADAKTVITKMKVGWNLGNSLDSVGGETKWGNPMVTPELIQAVADAGFGVVRVPVTWATHFGAAPNYTIDEAWMKRVEEIVGYVLDRNLYAIINVHHDGAENGDGEWISILDSSGKVTDSHTSAVKTQFVAIWKQIAARFKDKGERLLFESMNEIHVGYSEPPQEQQNFINQLNQTFVDTVRATGGNNASRCLIVPGYNTNIDYTLKGFVKPTDTAANKLILSVHYYDPWDYAGAGKTHVWGNASEGHDSYGQEDYVTAQFDKLKTNYVDANLPVLMGEYGAVNQTGYENYRRYYVEYVTKAAHDRGILPVVWDNGGTGTGADAFGLFSRTNNAILQKDIVDAILRAATSNYTLAQVAAP